MSDDLEKGLFFGFHSYLVVWIIYIAIGGFSYMIWHFGPLPVKNGTITSVVSAEAVQKPLCRQKTSSSKDNVNPPQPEIVTPLIYEDEVVVPIAYIEPPETQDTFGKYCSDYYDSSQWPVEARATVKLSVEGLEEQEVQVPVPLEVLEDETTLSVVLDHPSLPKIGNNVEVFVKNDTAYIEDPEHATRAYYGLGIFFLIVSLSFWVWGYCEYERYGTLTKWLKLL